MKAAKLQNQMKGIRGTSRHGLAIIYLAISLTTMAAITSLAVDFGRWEVCKTQMQKAADSAARAGALALASNYNYGLPEATAIVDANYVDGKTVGTNSAVTVSIQMLDWVSATNYVVLTSNYSTANAVRVTLTYNVPLTFGKVIGIANKSATRSSTAMIVVHTQNVYVTAKGDVWLAGEPNGTQASQADPNYQGVGVNPAHPWPYDIAGPVGGTAASGQPYASPQTVTIPITPGSLIAVSNVSGTGTFDPTITNSTANGAGESTYDDAASNGVSEHGIADVRMPIDSMNAVFLNNNVPDGTAAPAALDFSTTAAQNYSTVEPKLKQPFYVGEGKTTSGTQQYIVVPTGATRLFMGMMDGWEWNNNSGGYNATITEYQVQTVQ